MPSAIQVVFFDLGDTLVDVDAHVFLPGAKALVAQLRAKGTRLGIISNTGDLNRVQIAALLPPDFDWTRFEPGLVVFSSEIGVEKPTPAIFDAAVTKAGIAASLCLYCSENLIETLVAQKVGMRAARLQRPPQSDANALLTALIQTELVN